MDHVHNVLNLARLVHPQLFVQIVTQDTIYRTIIVSNAKQAALNAN